MSKITHVILTEATFIHGVLQPAGTELHVDLSKLGISSVDDEMEPEKGGAKAPAVPLAPNLVKASGSDAQQGTAVIAAVAPTGPAPTVPQAKLPGSVQVGEVFVAPGDPEAGTGASALAPEGGEAEPKPAAKRRPSAKRAPAKAKTDDKPAGESSSGGAGSALSE